MSSHKMCYKVYPDFNSRLPEGNWIKADRYINGCEFNNDLNSAIAIAKIAALSCNHPFTVVALPLGMNNFKLNLFDYWIVKANGKLIGEK